MMHAENGMAIDVVAAQTVAAGTTDPIGHGLARKAVFEGEATNRVIRLAEAAGVPGLHRPPLRARRARSGARRARPRLARRSPRRARSTCSCRSTTSATGSRARSSSARRRSARRTTGTTCGPGSSKDDLQLVVDRPLPVRLPRPEGARARRLPQGPQRPARRRGPHRPAPRRRRAWAAGSRRSAGSRSSRPRRRSCSGCTRRRARSPSARMPTSSSTTRTASARSRPRPITWTSTTRATRAAQVQGGSDVVLSRGSVIVRDGEFTGPKGAGRFIKRAPADYARSG